MDGLVQDSDSFIVNIMGVTTVLHQAINIIFIHLQELTHCALETPGNKPLPEPMLTQIYVAKWCH